MPERRSSWIHSLKRAIILRTFLVLTITALATMFFLRGRLIKENVADTEDVGNTIILGLKKLMMDRSATIMQETLETIGEGTSTLLTISIVDTEGTVMYSSKKGNLGSSAKESCASCHVSPGVRPKDTTILMKVNGLKIHRHMVKIRNETACQGCHFDEDVLGVLIIDRSMKAAYSLIAIIEVVILFSGVFLVIVLVPFLSKKTDQYVSEIIAQSNELTLLYMMMEQLSKSIDVDTLKRIVFDIVKNMLGAEQAYIVIPGTAGQFRVSEWRKSTGKIERKRLDPEDQLLSAIKRWQSGNFTKVEVSADGTAYMPIVKDGVPLALITVGKKDAVFHPFNMRLIEAISTQAAIAFENARLYTLAITDELTHLYSQRHFRHSMDIKFDEAKKTGGKLAFLMIDIDDFKKINDTYGHPAGDVVLSGMADGVLHSVRDSDLVFRYGGEEFAVILPDTGVEKGREVAERTRAKVEGCSYKAGDISLKITISIGVASYPDTADNIKDLIEGADEALYEAKRTGKNRVVVKSRAT